MVTKLLKFEPDSKGKQKQHRRRKMAVRAESGNYCYIKPRDYFEAYRGLSHRLVQRVTYESYCLS